jgi:hypothetical protein
MLLLVELQLQHFNRLGGIKSRRNALHCRGEFEFIAEASKLHMGIQCAQ